MLLQYSVITYSHANKAIVVAATQKNAKIPVELRMVDKILKCNSNNSYSEHYIFVQGGSTVAFESLNEIEA